MSDISGIEDKVIEAVKSLELFKVVDSAGRKALPTTLAYPSAFICWSDYKDLDSAPRPVPRLEFQAAIVDKNIQSEKAAARSTYALCEAVRDALNGKTLGLEDVKPFKVTSIEIADYKSGGEITYIMTITTGHLLGVPVPD
jgi:hypothetical protein